VSSTNGIQIRSRLAFFTLMAGTGLLLTAKNVHAQEALRISLAGDLAASARQQANSSIGYYNLLAGPTAWRFSTGLGMEFNDNVRLEQNGESDFIIRPSLDVELHWPLTLKNSLDVSVGAGYSDYLQHSDLSQFFINPGSGFSFDVYVGDFKINLHDRITMTEYGYQNPSATGSSENLVSLENTAGVGMLWDLDKILANFGYDHVNYTSLSQGQNQGTPDATSENIYVNGGVRLRPQLLLGLEAGATVINYSQNSTTNSPAIPSAVQWNAGVYGSAKVSEYIDFRVDAGFQDYVPDGSTATNLVSSDSSGFYLSATLSHRVNEHINYTLSFGRSTDLSAYGQAQSYYFVRLTPNWNFFRNYAVSTPVWWQHGTQVYYTSVNGQLNYDQFGIGLNINRSLTQKMSVGFSYQFVQENSDGTSLNYTANIVGLNFNYQF
jgi:hypothetical protein